MKLLTLDGKCIVCGERIWGARRLLLSQDDLTRKDPAHWTLTQKAISRIEIGLRVVLNYPCWLLP